MRDLLRRIFGMPSRAESRILAECERIKREMRDISRTCPHDCVSCDYFARVYEISNSCLRGQAAALKAEHVEHCLAGQPDSSSCTAFRDAI